MQYFHVKMCIHRTKDMEWVAYTNSIVFIILLLQMGKRPKTSNIQWDMSYFAGNINIYKRP